MDGAISEKIVEKNGLQKIPLPGDCGLRRSGQRIRFRTRADVSDSTTWWIPRSCFFGFFQTLGASGSFRGLSSVSYKGRLSWVDRSMLAWYVAKPIKSFSSEPEPPKSAATGAIEAGRVVPVLEAELSASPSSNSRASEDHKTWTDIFIPHCAWSASLQQGELT
jgi:hypothetical protein